MRRWRRHAVVVGGLLLLAGALATRRWLAAAEQARRKAAALQKVQEGTVRAQQGELEAALALWQAAASLDPQRAEPHKLAGRAYWLRRQYRQAVEALRQAYRLGPGDVEVLLQLIQALGNAGNYSEIEALCRQAVRLAPNHPKAHALLGTHLARYQPEAWKEAEAELRLAHQLSPRMPIPLVELGELCVRERRWREADEQLRRAWRLLHQGPLTVQFLETAAEVERRRAEVAFHRALLARQQGRAEEQQRHLSEFQRYELKAQRRAHYLLELQKAPNNVARMLDLAEMDLETESPREARGRIEQVLSLEPHNSRAVELARRVNELDR